MNIIKVKDFDSMQSITVSLARNGYLVTANSITDENYKDYWEIKYCEFSEIKEKPIVKDHDYSSFTEIHNNDNTKDAKCESLPDEKPLVENEKEVIDPNPYGLVPRDKIPNIPIIPLRDKQNIISNEQMEVITSVSGN